MDVNMYVKAVNEAYQHMYQNAQVRVAVMGLLEETTHITSHINLGQPYLPLYLSANDIQEHVGKLFQHAVLLGIALSLPLDETLQKNIGQLPK